MAKKYVDTFIFRNISAEAARLGDTHEQFAQKIGMAKSTFRDKLRRKRPFTSEELIKLAELTGKSIDYLLEVYEQKGA